MKADDKTAMKFLSAKKANDYYKRTKIGFAVNDGKYLTYIDDNEIDYEKELEKHDRI